MTTITPTPATAPGTTPGTTPGTAPGTAPLPAADPAVSYCLYGASPTSGNLGVSALCCSVLRAMQDRLPNAHATVFDYGRGVREATLFADNAQGGFDVALAGLNRSRRFYRPDAWHNIRLFSRFAPAANPVLRRMIRTDGWLDISGGDSFTDLYGPGRFELITAPKELILDSNRPLLLLPQTYGPFQAPAARQRAQRIVHGATLAYARDPDSFERLRELAGDDFDPERHRCGVDVAFLLPRLRPADRALEPLAAPLEDNTRPLVGLNVSGLIYNDPEAAVSRYGFHADYRRVIHELIRTLCRRSDATVVLMPHVIVPETRTESDVRACRAVIDALASEIEPDRLLIAPAFDDPRHAKWLISRFDFFCGTRMHATIAALSTAVPTAAIAYSLKTRGVFATCGQADHVAAPRHDDTDTVTARLLAAFDARCAAAEALPAALADVHRTARDQMDAIARVIVRQAQPTP